MRNINDRDTFDLSGFKKKDLDEHDGDNTADKHGDNSRQTLPSMIEIQETDPPTKFSCLMSSITADGNSLANSLGNKNSSGGGSSTSSLLSERLNGYKSLYNTNLSLAMPSISAASSLSSQTSSTGMQNSSSQLTSILNPVSQQPQQQDKQQTQTQQSSFTPIFQTEQPLSIQNQSQQGKQQPQISKKLTVNTQQNQPTIKTEPNNTIQKNNTLPSLNIQSPTQQQQQQLSSAITTSSTEGLLLLPSPSKITAAAAAGTTRTSSPLPSTRSPPPPSITQSQPLSQTQISAASQSSIQKHTITPQQVLVGTQTTTATNVTAAEPTITEDKLQGLGSRQSVAMIYSPTLNGNIAVQALPLAQIVISTYKIFKFRTFTVNLELSEAYMQKNMLTDDDILKAGLNSKCYKEGDFSTPLLSCQSCCPKKRIIELGVSSKQAFAPKKTTYGTLVYTFDTCKTNCSSSRDHHKSNLVIGIDSLPDAGIVASLPFVIQAREKQQGIRRGKNTVSSGTVLPTSVLSHSTIPTGPTPQITTLSPAFTQQLFSQSLINSNPNISDISKLSPNSNLMGPSQSSQPNVLVPSASTSPLPGSQQEKGLFKFQGIQQQFVSSTVTCSSRQKLDDLSKVNVLVLSSTLGSEESDRLLQDMRLYIQKLEGFLQLKYCISANLIIIFSFFETEAQHKTAESLIRNYLKNSDDNKNVYNINLIENGVVSIITVCPSW